MTNLHAGSATAPYNAFADPAHEAAPESPLPTVRTRPRADGWTPQRQHRFLDALALHGCVADACREVGLSPQSAYLLRARPDAAAFRAAWDASVAMALDRVEQTALARALQGWQDPICYGGQVIAHRQRHDTRLILKLLDRTDRLREAARTRAETRAAQAAQAATRAVSLAPGATPAPPAPAAGHHEDVLATPLDAGDRLARALSAVGHPDCGAPSAPDSSSEQASTSSSSGRPGEPGTVPAVSLGSPAPSGDRAAVRAVPFSHPRSSISEGFSCPFPRQTLPPA